MHISLISKVTIYSLDILLSQFGTSPLSHVWLFLLDLHTDFSGGRSGGLVFPSLEEFSTICCDPTVKGSVMSNSLRPHGLHHPRLPCPSATPRVHPNPCPLSQWCHPTILFSVVPFSCPQSFPALGSFQMSQLFTLGGQSIRVSASTSVLLMNFQDWFPLGWTGWISSKLNIY